ncbi:MAG: peptidoglycan bridge formation glycyltransferase FemA/FemB family protein [Anaerolineaceae bacterium]|nr:peptidoglycan bridge formation glycyltransferase FemA/FemB family protein [Anaerolineaceae bacterium]
MIDSQCWNEIIAGIPDGHLLQTLEWAEIKASQGWTSIRKVWKDENGNPCAAALILKKEISLKGIKSGFCILYIPRGPILDWDNSDLVLRVFVDLQEIAKTEKAIFVKVDPELILGEGIPDTDTCVDFQNRKYILEQIEANSWQYSNEQIQFKNTVWLDLTLGEDVLLASMKQKTRYNIRLASRKGVEIRKATMDDLELAYQMYAETSLRDGFAIRSKDYYLRVWKTFLKKDMATLLFAEVEGEIVAGLFLFYFGSHAWYLYGMSTGKHRKLMPNHLLQWEAIKISKNRGVKIYDFWGAPDTFNASDSMYGVFRFKDGFGAKVVRTMGAWDYPVYPLLYKAYTHVLPRLLGIMRRRGKQKTQQMLG